LKAIHEAGVIHRDIRLSNLCATATGKAFVIDFSHAELKASQSGKNRDMADFLELFDTKNSNAKSISPSRRVTSRGKGKVVHTVQPPAEGLRRSSRIKAMASGRQGK
jgi:tRNA A-37 threonylcarbamoyl transferase component Bud32